jgi:lycopene beta-cyclase
MNDVHASPASHGSSPDFVIVGGGLAGCLVALAKAELGAGQTVTLIEQGARLGGNHTWSFHLTDLDEAGWRLMAPLVEHHWPRHEVRFPSGTRCLDVAYATIGSARFAEVIEARLAAAGVRVVLGACVRAITADVVTFAEGTQIRGNVVIDARGPAPSSAPSEAGYQKFVGLELVLEEDGPWETPVVMDAGDDVTQAGAGGFRFVYVLPFSRRRVLVEDTVYGDDPALDPDLFAARVLAYAAAKGARVGSVLRREAGVLPLPLAGAPRTTTEAAMAIGYRGGFFHPVTGYSLPIAVRVARALAPVTTRAEAAAALAALRRELAPQQRFGHLLNRLMFRAMAPLSRWTALERFYRMPAATIERFYASRTTWWDRARLLLGRPPRGLSWRPFLPSTARSL